MHVHICILLNVKLTLLNRVIEMQSKFALLVLTVVSALITGDQAVDISPFQVDVTI